jgi:hypothetical protein
MSYANAVEADVDRAQQRALLLALNAWNRALRRDECGDWTISGTRGTIHTWGNGKSWVLYVSCNSGQHWTWVKKKVPFCTVTQDAHDEGVLRLDQLPTPGQADILRDLLGIRKRREVCAEVLDRLKSFAFDRRPHRGTSVWPKIGKCDLRPPKPAPDQTPVLAATPAK